MATGILGKADLTATTNTTVYTVPGSKVATVSVNVCNRNATQAKVRLAMSTTGTPAGSDYIEYDTVLAAGAVLERSALVANAATLFVLYSDVANVSVVIYGFEE